MATRKNLAHHAIVRERIRASQIINRLTDHVDGKIELSSTQVRAAEILLKKTVPDLVSVEHSGEIEHKYAMQVPAPAASVEEWQQQQTPRLQ